MKETLYVDITTIPPSMVVSFMNKSSMLSFVGVSGIVVVDDTSDTPSPEI